MKCAQTFTAKDVPLVVHSEELSSAATEPPQEVPQSDDQDGDTGNATNHTTNDWADRDRNRGRDGQSR